jgi:hypothetical protein
MRTIEKILLAIYGIPSAIVFYLYITYWIIYFYLIGETKVRGDWIDFFINETIKLREYRHYVDTFFWACVLLYFIK